MARTYYSSSFNTYCHLYDENYMWYAVMNEERKAPLGNIRVRVEDDCCAGVQLKC